MKEDIITPTKCVWRSDKFIISAASLFVSFSI